ncbi:hypothetical protein GALL_417100 [mine drainage metagenome]|uniref:Uncharacterized protein n=1 Tax=mine drainage metagenome TaxID=410659 RepID=A0A1J5QGH4_9ZZZZ
MNPIDGLPTEAALKATALLVLEDEPELWLGILQSSALRTASSISLQKSPRSLEEIELACSWLDNSVVFVVLDPVWSAAPAVTAISLRPRRMPTM